MESRLDEAAQAASSAAEYRDAREPVLDPVERVCELCFGLFMALTFVGLVSAATTHDPNAGRMMFTTALGCNLAWGLADAVMYLVRTLAARGRRLSLALDVRRASDAASARRLLHEALPGALRSVVGPADLEPMRARLAAAPVPDRPRFRARDFTGAFGIFLMVVLGTFPVALPFLLFDDARYALLVSRVLTLVMLFACGLALGRYAGFGGWRAGLAMTVVGCALTAAIIALGG